MRKLLVLAVVVIGMVIADVVVRTTAESALADGIRDNTVGVGSVTADIDSFPFTGRLLAGGHVSKVDVRLDDVTGYGIDVAQLRIEAFGLVLGRRALYGGGVRIEDVDSVTVTAVITEGAIRAVTGADVRLRPGRAEVTVRGVTFTATAAVVAGTIRLTIDPLPAVSVPLPTSDLVPCTLAARVEEAQVVATCTADHLPTIVTDAVGTVPIR